MSLQLTEETFEEILQKETLQQIDLRRISFIDPYGMVGILEPGELYTSKGIQKTIYLPESEEVIKYLERMDFFKYAANYFALEPPELLMPEKYSRNSFSDVLLEITPIEKSDDMDAIEKALLYGASRYTDTGRGHGLAAARRFIKQWNGKISIRSGTARLSIIPKWAWGNEKEQNLTHFPGTQINIMLPEV